MNSDVLVAGIKGSQKEGKHLKGREGKSAKGGRQILHKDSGRQIRERTQRRMLEKYNVPVGVITYQPFSHINCIFFQHTELKKND